MIDELTIVSNVHDGVPISGLAKVRGVPYTFEAIFDPERDCHTSVYQLWPADRELVELLLAHSRTFGAWYPTRGTELERPEERPDFDGIEAEIARQHRRVGPPVHMRAKFTRNRNEEKSWNVVWTPAAL